MAIAPVTCGDVASSTIHSPYYYFWPERHIYAGRESERPA